MTAFGGSGILTVPQSLLKGCDVRLAALILLTSLVALPPTAARAGDGRLVAVEFQAASDNDMGIAYLLFSSVSETLISESGGRIAAGEDVEMYLGSSAVDCHEKQSCLDRLAEEFDAAAMVYVVVARRGTDIDIDYKFYSCASGRQLDGGEVTYEAGDEGQLADLILDRMDDVLEKAERDEDGDYDDDHSGAGGGVAVAAGGDADDDIDWEDDDRDDDHAITGDDGHDDEDTGYDAEDTGYDDEDTGYDDEDTGYDDEDDEQDRRDDEDGRGRWDDEEERGSWDDEDDEDTEEERDDSRADEDDADEEDGEEATGDGYRPGRRNTESGRSRYNRDAAAEDRDDEDDDDEDSASGRYSAREYLREDGRGHRASRDEEEEEPRSGSSRYSRYSPDEGKGEDEEEERTSQTGRRRGGRKPKHPEDHPANDRGADIDPSLMETFDDEDAALFDETSRSGTGTLTYQEASEKGMGPAEYNRYAASGMTYEDWSGDRYNHKGKFHLRFAGFYALGGLDTYYSSRVVMWDASDILETYYWQSFGFSAASGGGTIGVGFGVAPAVDLSLEVALLAGKQWLLRQYRTPDKSESTISDVDPGDIPKGTALHFLIEPKVRLYFTPFKRVKPYAGFGLAMMVMPPFEVPEEWVQDRPATFILGLEPTLGLQIDSPLGVGFFFEIPFTGYIASDHGVESGLEGEVRELRENEMNAPPSPVPRYMLRFQVGVQVRM